MTDMVFISNGIKNQEPFTTSEVIAEYALTEHRAIKQLIRSHKNDLEEFGVLTFEMSKPIKRSKGGRPEKNYKLNEQQATLVITYLQNTAPVRAFKKELVRQFFLMRSELIKWQQARADLKPIRRELIDAIRDRPDLSSNRWAYKQFTDLAYKQAIGKTSAVIKRERGAMPDSTAVSFLSSEELEVLQTVSNQIAVLIDLGMDYEEIKKTVSRPANATHSHKPTL